MPCCEPPASTTTSPAAVCAWVLQVWLAEWTGVQVAVKELYGLQGTNGGGGGDGDNDQGGGGGGSGGGGSNSSSTEYLALMNEVTLLANLSHPNIMRFLAVREHTCVAPQWGGVTGGKLRGGAGGVTRGQDWG